MTRRTSEFEPERAPRPAGQRTSTPQTPVHAVLSLQAAVGNAATARLLRDGTTGGDLVSYPDDPLSTSQSDQPALSADDQRKLGYARTTLARIPPLPEADEKALQKLIPGTTVLNLIRERDEWRTKLDGLVEGAKQNGFGRDDPVRPEHGGQRLSDKMNVFIERVEKLTGAIQDACTALGLKDETELKGLVEDRFPKLFLQRAKTIALQVLTDNEKLATAESDRFGVRQLPLQAFDYKKYAAIADGTPDKDAVAGARAAGKELHGMELELKDAWNEILAINQENIKLADDEDMDWGTDENSFWAPDLSPKSPAAHARHEQLQMELTERRNQLGLQFPVLLRLQSYEQLANGSDDTIRSVMGTEVAKVLGNIAETRENIEKGDLKVWHLRDIFEMTMQDLGLTGESPLIKAVETHVAAEERKKSIIDMAITAIGLTAAILAAIPSAGTSLVVAGTLVAAGTGVYQLSQSVGAYYSEKAAEDVAIDPVMADISLKSPDLKAVAFDLAGLGLDAFDLLKVVNLLGDSIRAARRTGDLLDLARRAAAIPQLGEEGTRVLMASVTREVQIQQGITRVITALGKHFKPGDIADIAADMARLDERIVSEALTHLQASGRVRPLTEDVLEEIYGLEGAAHRITNSGWLTAQGMYDPSNGMLFLKGGRFEEISSSALHEIVHHLQTTRRPAMATFHKEFEAFAAQRSYLQSLARSGVDPDMAFPSWKWLMEATNDDIIRHLATNPMYRLTPAAGFDAEAAVMDALTNIDRIGVRNGDTMVGLGPGKAPRTRTGTTSPGIGTVGPGTGTGGTGTR